jgi:hypothetical protein
MLSQIVFKQLGKKAKRVALYSLSSRNRAFSSLNVQDSHKSPSSVDYMSDMQESQLNSI